MFSFIKNTLKKIYTSVTSRLGTLFGTHQIDQATLKELEIILLGADTGVATTKKIIASLKEKHSQGEIAGGDELKKALHTQLEAILDKPAAYDPNKKVFILVGINGSGKTTFAAKLAHHHAKQGKKVLLVAADTFRAAARQQLQTWAERINVDMVVGDQNQDPASVIFQGCDRYKKEGYDILIIDTAGRLQTKTNLMNELSKIKRVISKQLDESQIDTLLTVDSMLGQNSLAQATLFKESTDVSGIVLTKMDGTGKGGIVFAIADQLTIPVAWITYGEAVENSKLFDKREYIDNLLSI